jgi:hypothetical protein
MDSNLLDFLNDFNDQGGDELQNNFQNLFGEIGEDAEMLNKYAQKMNKYKKRLHQGQMSKQDFEVRVRDITRLTEMQALKLDVANKARVQALVNEATDLILNKLVGAVL